MRWTGEEGQGRSTLAVLMLMAIGWALGIGLYLAREQGRTTALVMAGTAAALQALTALWALREMEKRRVYEGRTKEGPPRYLIGTNGFLWEFVADGRHVEFVEIPGITKVEIEYEYERTTESKGSETDGDG